MLHNLASSDGVLQENDIDGASVYVDGVNVPYSSPAVQVKGFWLTHETSLNGAVSLVAWADEDASDELEITADFNITKIEFRGVSYYPANI